MRIWSLHPIYLDSKRLTAQWREALLCRKVLAGETKGYKYHPQFQRVKDFENPKYFINGFLYFIWTEANRRGYSYNKDKLVFDTYKLNRIQNLMMRYGKTRYMSVTKDQLIYEFKHLQYKLQQDKQYHINENRILQYKEISTNPMFVVIEGPIMKYEKIKQYNDEKNF